MEVNNFDKLVTVPVALKGGSNYVLWSRLVKTAIGRLRLWSYITNDANGAGSSGASSGTKVGESEGRALAFHQLSGMGMDQEVFKRADLEAFFKALKESGNSLGNTLGYSYAAHTLPSTTDKLLDIFKSSYTAASDPSITDKALASHQLSGKGMDQEVFKRADLEAFFKALKESV
ncbi:hypothetical protein DY000_02047907 [Brassica cretica]|uniref:Retrotransposon Copia-like N-terminal domain-containing protein n=1 Tax=Brassica cretica TaxID=69181 RepID=A0ABQ7F3E3_BRACR|nr:hypothetical protein DY000_02047907 [Brassica cretica]